MSIVNCRECGKEVSGEANKCIHCGCYTPDAKKYKLFRTVAVVVIVVLGFTFCYLFIDALYDGSGTNQEQIQSNNTADKKEVSLANFNKIEIGMTYQQVCEIFGSNGELLSEVNLGFSVTRMVQYDNKKGFGNAIIVFDGNSVQSKSQFGLK